MGRRRVALNSSQTCREHRHSSTQRSPAVASTHLQSTHTQNSNMQRVVLIASMVCVMLAASASAQRPFYAPNPWYDKYQNNGDSQSGGSTSGASSSSSSSTSTSSQQPLGDRFLTPAENNVSFKIYNNVPIEGPDAPCVGCTYRLTTTGFVRQR